MPDQPQQSDPWATVRERSEFIGIRRVVAWEDVDAARAEVKRRHAEELSIVRGQKNAAERREAELEAHVDVLEKCNAEALKAKDAERDALLSDMSHLEMANAVLRAQLDQQAQRYNAALDRLIADKDQLSLAGSRLRAQRAAVQSATPEAVTRELERGHYSIIRAWLALHGGTSAQIAVEEMAQLVRSFGEPLTLKEPTGYSRSEFERDRMGEVFGAARAEGAEGMKLSQKRRNAVYAAIHRTLTDLRIDLKLALSQDVRVAQSEIALMKAVEQALEGGARHE